MRATVEATTITTPRSPPATTTVTAARSPPTIALPLLHPRRLWAASTHWHLPSGSSGRLPHSWPTHASPRHVSTRRDARNAGPLTGLLLDAHT